MGWESLIGPIASAGAGILSGMSSGNQTQGGTPNFIKKRQKKIAGYADTLMQRPWQPYTGQRYYGPSDMELQAAGLAQGAVGSYAPYMSRGNAALGRAEQAYGRANQNFTDADIGAYMNPYIRQALEPAAEKVSLEGAQALNRLRDQRVSRGAFGGGRQAMLEAGERSGTQKSLSDLYKTGLSDAFDRASGLWSADRQNQYQQGQMQGNLANQWLGMGQGLQGFIGQDINRLGTAGQNIRNLDQRDLDFAYEQWMQQQGYPMQNLKDISGILSGMGTSNGVTEGSNPYAQGIGGALSVMSMIPKNYGGWATS